MMDRRAETSAKAGTPMGKDIRDLPSIFTANTVVAASAGTGKTRALVAAYLERLHRGEHPHCMVAITFTEKAAAELRERIQRALYVRTVQEPETAAGSMRALRALSTAPVSTIHGFCMSILREFGAQAGLDPAFAVLDEVTSADLCRKAAESALREGVRKGDPAITALFRSFDPEKLVSETVATINRLNGMGVGPEWLALKADEQLADAETLKEHLSAELDRLGCSLEDAGLLADQVETSKAKKHALWDRKSPSALLPRVGQILGATVSKHWAVLISEASRRFQAEKKSLNRLDFDDLLIATRDLLASVADVRLRLQQRFSSIFVDEFQDTDEIQAEIVSWLAADPADPTRLSASKLFIAADAKQSIYSFRRARVTVFVRMMERIRLSGGKVQPLQNNFRSARELVAFSNALSAIVLDGLGKKDYQPRPETDLSYRIRFTEHDVMLANAEQKFLGITYLAADPEVQSEQGRRLEAEALARTLQEWKGSGRIQSWRQVTYLLRSMRNVAVYSNALQLRGIPAYVVQGSGFYQKSEVSDLIAFLEWIANPHDDFAKAVVLSSPLGGLSMERVKDVELPPKLNRVARHWMDRRDSASPAEILQDVVRRLDYDVLLTALSNGEQRVANVGKLIEITRDLARQGTFALDDVVRHLRARASDLDNRTEEAQVVGQDDDVVRLMSVHQAKGLEFDVVVIPDVSFLRPSTGATVMLTERRGLLCGAAYGLHRKTVPHSLLIEARELDEDEQYEEQKRLLYVAVTRARRGIIFGEAHSRRAGLWSNWLGRLLDDIAPGSLADARAGTAGRVTSSRGGRFHVDLIPVAALNGPQQLTLSTGLCEDRTPVPLVDRPASLRVPSGRLAVSASELAEWLGCPTRHRWLRREGRPEFSGVQNGPDLKSIGTEVHRFLETGVRQASIEVDWSELEDVLASDEWLRLRSSEPELELPFVFGLEAAGRSCYVHGRMDAAVARSGSVPLVVDYKYSAWRPGAESDYAVPMTLYAYALMRSTGSSGATAELWYLRRPMKVIRTPYEVSEVERRIRGWLTDFVKADESEHLQRADRAFCDHISCGFRSECWGA